MPREKIAGQNLYLSIVLFDAHTVDSSGKMCLCTEVFLMTLFAEYLLFSGIGSTFCAVFVNLFGEVGGVYQDEHLALFDL